MSEPGVVLQVSAEKPRLFVVEYDENSIVWLVDVETKGRVPLEHGMLILAMVNPGSQGGS